MGIHYTHRPANVPEICHIHPLADECLILWRGQAQFYMGDGWLEAETNDCALAPCGVYHGTRNQVECIYGGFASPPQLDLLMNSGYYKDGVFLPVPWERLSVQ